MMLGHLPKDTIFLQHDADIEHAAEFCGENVSDVTGAVAVIENGEYIKVWLSQSSAPYALNSEYYQAFPKRWLHTSNKV